jgi:hypothetical protein
MRAILRQVSRLGTRVITLLAVFGMLTPPFGLRALMEARAADQADLARHTVVVQRPTAIKKVAAIQPREYAISLVPSVVDGVGGKGGWFMIFNGDWSDSDADRAQALVDSAVRADLSHIYIRVADSYRHFYGAPALQDLLPLAHAQGLKVIGWIEPMLDYPDADAADALAAATYSSEGQTLDGLALTIEGDYTGDPQVGQYLAGIRQGVHGYRGVGDQFLLIASTFPDPGDHPGYAYATMSRYCQVFAPMAYWRATGLPQYVGDDGVRAFVDQTFAAFRDPTVNPYNRPITITAQAYDAVLENGTPGSPPADEIVTSMDETRAQGGLSWSFYRLADATNGVTADEAAAITAFPFWQRPAAPLIPTKPLIASTEQPVAY